MLTETPPSADSVFSAVSSVSGPIDTKDTNGTLRFSPRQRLQEWRTGLGSLSLSAPLHGITPHRWRALLVDAEWIFTNFAEHAARDGFSAADLFGVLPSRPGWGGLCDRLKGSRNLKMDADRAAWSLHGVREQFCQGGGDDLVASGLVLIWEPAR